MSEVDGVIDLTMEEAENEKMPADNVGEGGVLDACDSDSFSLGTGVSGRQRNAYQDYMPMYQDICKQASAPGEYGKKCHAMMNVMLKKLKQKCDSLSVDTSNNSTGLNCASYPAISTKRVAKRLRMATSSCKNGKRKKKIVTHNFVV